MEIEEFDIPKLYHSVHTQMLKAEEQVLREVLRMVLKRDETIEDAKRLTKGIMPMDNIEGDAFYLLAFDDVQIGKVVFRMRPFEGNMSVTFEPDSKYK